MRTRHRNEIVLICNNSKRFKIIYTHNLSGTRSDEFRMIMCHCLGVHHKINIVRKVFWHLYCVKSNPLRHKRIGQRARRTVGATHPFPLMQEKTSKPRHPNTTNTYKMRMLYLFYVDTFHNVGYITYTRYIISTNINPHVLCEDFKDNAFTQ